MKPAILICAAFLLFQTGCVFFAVPAPGNKVAWGTRVGLDDLAFVQCGETSHQEVESRLGMPWTNYSDLRVSVYSWDTVAGYWVWLVYAPIGGAGAAPIERTHILFVEFDEDDRVKKLKIMPHPRKLTTRDTTLGWLGSR